MIERGIYLILGISPVVLSLAYYLYFQHLLGLRFFAWFAIIAVLAMGAFPFAVKILLPAVVTVKKHCSFFEEALGLSLWRSFIAAELPGLVPSLNAAFFSCFALAIGNLSVIAMFSQSGIETIPLLIYRLMGVYRFDEAALISAVFAVFSLAIVTASVQQQQRGLRGMHL
jgi:thiamine transport system permease protein